MKNLVFLLSSFYPIKTLVDWNWETGLETILNGELGEEGEGNLMSSYYMLTLFL